MFGKNKIAPIISKAQNQLAIVEIFLTLQGEGPYVGRSAIFVRLGGCNLQCKFCDTEFDNYELLKHDEIIKRIEQVNKYNSNLIVITGGEPLRQNISKLCKLLINLGFTVQIETNGTILRKLPDQVKIICSPKLINNKNYDISEELINYVDAFKFLIAETGPYASLPKLSTDKPIYLQAIDSYHLVENQKNLAYAVKLALQHNYILSLQTHKILNIS